MYNFILKKGKIDNGNLTKFNFWRVHFLPVE